MSKKAVTEQENRFIIAGTSEIEGVLVQCPYCYSIFKIGREKCPQCGRKVELDDR